MPLPTPDKTFTAILPDEGGLAFKTAQGTIVDQVGTHTGSTYKEGTVLSPSVTVSKAWERKRGGVYGSCQDTENNANDFQIIDPDAQNLASPPTPCFNAPANSPCHVLISGFRSRGAGGSADQFIELFNPTAGTIDISNYQVWLSDNLGNTTQIATIPPNTLLGAGRHYLLGFCTTTTSTTTSTSTTTTSTTTSTTSTTTVTSTTTTTAPTTTTRKSVV